MISITLLCKVVKGKETQKVASVGDVNWSVIGKEEIIVGLVKIGAVKQIKEIIDGVRRGF